MSRRRKKADENLIALLLELTDLYWPIGAASAALFSALGLLTLSWILGIKAGAEASPILAPLANSVGTFLFTLPGLCFLMAAVSGAKAFQAFFRDRH